MTLVDSIMKEKGYKRTNHSILIFIIKEKLSFGANRMDMWHGEE